MIRKGRKYKDIDELIYMLNLYLLLNLDGRNQEDNGVVDKRTGRTTSTKSVGQWVQSGKYRVQTFWIEINSVEIGLIAAIENRFTGESGLRVQKIRGIVELDLIVSS